LLDFSGLPKSILVKMGSFLMDRAWQEGMATRLFVMRH
jgi:hypothetical protein